MKSHNIGGVGGAHGEKWGEANQGICALGGLSETLELQQVQICADLLRKAHRNQFTVLSLYDCVVLSHGGLNPC